MIFFVYGTLKKNKHNHYLLNGCKYLSDFETEKKYTLFDGGFPIIEREGGTSIKGELYETSSESIINNIFSLEGCTKIQHHPSNWYDFDKIETPYGEAVIFVMDKNKSNRNKILTNGIW